MDLTYLKQGAESNGAAGDKYNGRDRFGRIVDQRWIEGSTTIDRFQYGYDRDSNRLFRDNLLDNNYDELYHADGNNGYDSLNRLPEFQRGALSDGYGSDGIPDTVSSASRYQVYTLDAQGNFDSVNTSGTSVNRTDNAQNEITVVDGNNLTYDNNGNLTTDETGKQFVWDAWNRLVQVKDSGSNTIITYTIDALGRRIRENAGSNRDFFFTAGWQVIEERTGSGNGTTRVQYVWSTQYQDALLERKRDTDDNGTLDEALYPTWDANYNITAVANSSGAIQERYVTDPYGGNIIYLDASWGTQGSSSYAWNIIHQGRSYEALTGLYDSRHRQYSPTLFVWIGMDPIGFGGGTTNLYGYVGDSPGNGLDPMGLRRRRRRRSRAASGSLNKPLGTPGGPSLAVYLSAYKNTEFWVSLAGNPELQQLITEALVWLYQYRTWMHATPFHLRPQNTGAEYNRYRPIRERSLGRDLRSTAMIVGGASELALAAGLTYASGGLLLAVGTGALAADGLDNVATGVSQLITNRDQRSFIAGGMETVAGWAGADESSLLTPRQIGDLSKQGTEIVATATSIGTIVDAARGTLRARQPAPMEVDEAAALGAIQDAYIPPPMAIPVPPPAPGLATRQAIGYPTWLRPPFQPPPPTPPPGPPPSLN